MRPYTSRWRGIGALLSDLNKDYRANLNPAAKVSRNIDDAITMEQFAFGCTLSGCDVLDIGPGQVPIQLTYFSLRNRATGIDINRVIEHRTASALLQLAHEEGIVRGLKTFGRWTLGVDARMLRALAETLGVDAIKWPTILQMDARELRFDDASFDFIYSRSTFQHIQDPEKALCEIYRTLRPGGTTYVGVHLWTCPNGFTYVDMPYSDWPHLRGAANDRSIDHSRNRLRLAEWKELFNKVMPGVEFVLSGLQSPETVARAAKLRNTELQDYSLEELTHSTFAALWRKPV